MKRTWIKKTLSALLIFCILLGILPPLSFRAKAAASPSSSGNATATLAYTLKNLPLGVAVQNFYIGAQYIYATQRSTGTTYLSRLKKDDSAKTATYCDHMVLNTWGHGETLDFYTYNGKEYFLIGTKASSATDYYWSTQIARLTYQPGKTYNTHTEVPRFTTMDKANSDGSNDGEINRVAAAICGSYTIFRIQSKKTDGSYVRRYSIYDTTKLNAALDSTTTGNYLEMKSSAAKAALKKTFTQSGSTYIHPNDSFQGIELSSKDSIYLTGGGNGDTPQIAMMNESGSYKKLISVTNVGKYEIEGGQADRGKFYFLIIPNTNSDAKKNTQVIYYINESSFGINHSITNIAGYAATCTAVGLSDGATCTKCNFPQDVQEVLPALGHIEQVLPAVEPTATSNGLTEGKICTRAGCNAVLVAQKEIAAADYTYVKATPIELALDYGKPVKFSTDDLFRGLDYNDLDVTVTFVGMLTEGGHSTVSTYKPDDLQLTQDGDQLTGTWGIYTREGDTFRFVPKGLMEGVDTLYAVFRAKNIFGLEWYLEVKLDILPATSVYYEAESLLEDNVLTVESVENDETNNDFTLREDNITEDRSLPVVSYDPTDDENVIYFGFDNSPADIQRYGQNSVYGDTNFDTAQWVGKGNTNIFGVTDNERYNPPGALNLLSWNNVGTYLQIYSPETLNYVPSAEDWIEIRLRFNDVVANDGVGVSVCPEFYTSIGNTHTRTRPTTRVILSEVGTDWFVVKMPIVSSNSWPSTFQYKDAGSIRCISLTFEGMKIGYGHCFSVDYFYVGPEETCPSNLNAECLYFGFDNTTADQYRYLNPIYGKRNDFDKSPKIYDDWAFNIDITPSVSIENGTINMTVGQEGSVSTNSPWIQTLTSETDSSTLDFSASYAEQAQVKLKFSNLTTYLNPENGLDRAVVRLGFVLDHHSSYEVSTCWVEWPLTDAQLNGSDYMTLTADISDLLVQHNAKRIRGVRLTIVNGASLAGTTGTVTVDYIYIGSGLAQSSDFYISAPATEPIVNPEKELYTPNYDSRVLYFGFDNTELDQIRYSYNSIYGNSNTATPTYNYDANGSSIRWAIAKSFTSINVTDGALKFTGTTVDSWGHIYTKDNTLKYTPTDQDYMEIRVNVAKATANNGSSLCIELAFKNAAGKQTKFNNASFSASKVGEGYFLLSVPINDSTYWADPGHSTSSYTGLGTITRVEIIPSWLKSGSALDYSIDYFYLGPAECRPSQLNKDYLYFDFENDEAAQYKYASDIYGANYDSGNWDYHKNRSSAPSIKNGVMSATVTTTGHPWFETKKGGFAGTPVMSYYPNKMPSKPEEVQIRVRFYNVKKENANNPVVINAFFFDASDHRDETVRATGVVISDTDISTNGKWFTYRIPLKNILDNLNEADSFRFNFQNLNSSNGQGTVEIDYVYVGPALRREKMPFHTDVYGYDEIYGDDPAYSDHKALLVEGKGAALPTYKTDDDGGFILDEDGNKTQLIDYTSVDAYTKYEFTFKGTGFDIISRTGAEQGAIRVYICDSEGSIRRSISVQNKGNTELYQVPVVSVRDLAYGSYTVHIFVNSAVDYSSAEDGSPDGNGDIYGGLLDRGGEFYLDAVRIYSPINTATSDETASLANTVYQAHGEAAPTFYELRDILIDAGNFGEQIEGVVYLDATASEDMEFDNENGKLDFSVAEYKGIGPKNEVYLAPGNAIAFKLEVEGRIPASIDIGTKCVGETMASLLIKTDTSAPSTVPTGEAQLLATSTELYYPLEIPASQWQTSEDLSYVYVIIYNSGSQGILSVTSIKFAYDTPAIKSRVRFVVDTAMMDILSQCKHNYVAVITEPTCMAEGFTTYTCSVCGDTYTGDPVAAIGHAYTEKVTAPTCTEAGLTTYTCENCGDSYTGNEIPATGHSFASGTCASCGAKDPDHVIPNPFTDVKEGDYFYDAVLWAVKEGVTTGTSATTFGPEKPCTRGQVVTFLWRACGSPEPTKTDNPFSDVKESAYYYKAVLWAVEQGITTGISKTAFAPDKTCTRGQVATFLWRAQGKPNPTTTTNPFTDIAEDFYYYSAVLWAVEEGITNGTGKGLFSPDKDCTRGQIVTFLYRALS